MSLVEYLVKGLKDGVIKQEDLNGVLFSVKTTVIERYCRQILEKQLMEADTAV